MQYNQSSINAQCCNTSLNNTDHSCLSACFFECGKTKLMSDSKSDKAQSYIRNHGQGIYPFSFQKATLIRVLLISAFGGAILSLDAWTFANWIPQLKDSYTAAGSFDVTTWIASILYGGVTEEIMIRLFLMSGLALLGWKLFFRSEEQVPIKVLVIANILSALVFAAGHLPVTAQTFGTLTPLLLLRCFLLNGTAGLLFGRFYRKYGIQYAILAHMLFHLVSRTIWLIAIP